MPDARPHPRTLAAWTFLVISPFLLLIAVSFALGRSVLQSVPVWTDELDYWRAVYSWLHVGGGAGYSGIGELTASMGTLSVHGIAPILLYALPASIFGWTYSSIVIINSVWVSAGALVYCVLNRPKALVSVMMGVSLMIYAPAILYCATSMTEMANYGLLLFYLAFLMRLAHTRQRALASPNAARPPRGGRISLVLCVITVLVCCAYRISYLGLWLPLIWVAFDGRPSLRMLLWLGLSGLASLGVYAVTSQMASPFAAGFLYNLFRTDSLGLAVRMFLSHGKANLLDYFVRAPGNPMEGVQRILYFSMMGLMLVSTFLRVHKQEGRWRLRLGFDSFSLMAFAMLLLPFVIIVSAYETNDWADYRTLAPFLWLTVAAHLALGRKALPALYLAGCAVILAVLISLPPVGAFSDETRFDPAPPSAETRALLAAITYDADAADPHVNAVRTDIFTLDTITLLHPGMGIQTGWLTERNVGKSGWIYTDYLKIPLEGYTLVQNNGSGSVYRKLADPEQE